MSSQFTMSPAAIQFFSALFGGGATGETTFGDEMSPQLLAFLEAIPFANDGDVITADHHNTLRAAVAQIGRALDESQFTRFPTVTQPATLLPVLNATPWRSAEASSVGQAPEQGRPKIGGWMPIELPTGTRIDALVVHGLRGGAQNVGVWTASLTRVDISGSNAVDVCHGTIKNATLDAAGNFTAEVPPVTEDLAPGTVAERRRVDTSRYRYHVRSAFQNADQPDSLSIKAVQVRCTRG